MKKNFLSKYFNKQTFSSIGPAPMSLAGVVTVGLLLSSGSMPAVGFALVIGTITAGYVNKWQEAASGKPFWTPRTPFFGL